jgi:glucose/arabinose dehydrogenase
VYVYYTYEDGEAVYNRVSRLREEAGKAVDEEVLLGRIPAAPFHNGGVLTFGPDGKLYITTGDATESSLAQDRSSLAGKVLRLNDDGAIPDDNPFPGSPVYTLGHRNVFGIAFHPASGQPYITENGTSRDDEVNRLLPGANYGWPFHLGVAHATGYQDPLFTFTPNIAPTQAVFYTGDQLPGQYQGNLFFGDWNTGSLHRVVLDETGAVKQHEVVLRVPGGGILDVEQGPDGYLYFSTASAIYTSAIYRVVVKQ